MEKKLYLFKPAERWSYCGGVIAMIAESFEECKTLHTDKLFLLEEEAEKAEESFHIWVLDSAIPTYQDEKSRIVLEYYNWG